MAMMKIVMYIASFLCGFIFQLKVRLLLVLNVVHLGGIEPTTGGLSTKPL